MNSIDPHHHLWEIKKGRYPWLDKKGRDQEDYLIEDFLADCGDQKVVKSVHVQAEYDKRRPVEETRFLQAVADDPGSKGFPHGIVAWADFSDPGAEAIIAEHCRYPNVRGIRQILNAHEDPELNYYTEEDYLKNPLWRRNFGLLKKYGLSFDLQLYFQQMEEAAALAGEHPDISIILNHTGMPAERDEGGLEGWRGGMRTLSCLPNISAKISGLGMFDPTWSVESIRPFVLTTIELFGIERCMFASNFPVDKAWSDYDTLWKAFKTITKDFSESERQMLFHDNAERYYRL